MRMKKLKKILLALVAIAACIVYIADELQITLSDITGEAPAAQTKTASQAKTAAQTKTASQAKSAAPAALEIPVLQKDVPSQILEYTGHTLSYNNQTRLPNWVAYELTDTEVKGENPRKDKFARDPQAKGAQGSKEDYRNSGWDRGHMAPAGDMKWDTKAMDETYYFTNICPQNHELNNGDWKELEEKCRDWAEKYGSVYIVCGPIITENVHGLLGENNIVIPDKFFKAVIVKKNGEYLGAGFLYTNYPKRTSKISTKPGPDRPLESYMVTIDELEAATGMDFFPKLPDAIETAVEKQSTMF